MDDQSVIISRRGAERLAKGHPWIYRGDVEKAPASLASGDVVVLKDGRGRFLARAFWSALSKIALRVVSRDDVAIDEAFFADLLAAATPLRSVVERNDAKVRQLEGLPLVKGVVRGAEPGPVEYREGAARMRLDVLG